MVAASRIRAAQRPCIAPGCPEPRYVSPKGYVDSRCRLHEAEESRRRYVAGRSARIPYVRATGDKADHHCLGPIGGGPPCDRPRRVSPIGKVDGRCTEHAAEAQLVWHQGDTVRT